MLRILFLITVLMSSTVLAQKSEKPKAYLFDEFGKISTKEIKLKTQKLRAKIREKAWSDEPLGAYLVFYYGENQKTPENLQIIIRNELFRECRDCMGWSPNILFVDGGKSKEQKVQFWLVPFGAEPPTFN